jgi:hypothetical protein
MPASVSSPRRSGGGNLWWLNSHSKNSALHWTARGFALYILPPSWNWRWTLDHRQILRRRLHPCRDRNGPRRGSGALTRSPNRRAVTSPPNTRMQRTRSSPTALRSPLMRCPLGGTKRRWWLHGAVAALVVLACRADPQRATGATPTATSARSSPSPSPAPSPTATVYRVGDGTTAPRLTSKFEVEIPEKCRKSAVEGAFIFEATITAAGRVSDIRTVQRAKLTPACPEVEEACRNAISRWVYEPAIRNGEPVPVYLTISVGFHV